MNKEMLEQARILRNIGSFIEAEKARISMILHFAGIAEARLTFRLPAPPESPVADKLLEGLAFAMTVEYTSQERPFILPSVKLGATTIDGVPVLAHPGSNTSIQHLVGLVQDEAKCAALNEILSQYQGASPQDAYARIGSQLLTEALLNDERPNIEAVDISS